MSKVVGQLIQPVDDTVAGSAAAVLAGTVIATSIFVESLRIKEEERKKRHAPRCNICKGKGFYSCKLCKGSSTIEWSPLDDPIAINPCVCPTCSGNRVQRCLNCLGKGYAYAI